MINEKEKEVYDEFLRIEEAIKNLRNRCRRGDCCHINSKVEDGIVIIAQELVKIEKLLEDDMGLYVECP